MSAARLQTEVDELKCSICFDDFDHHLNKPRALPCLHSFHLRCLRDLCNDARPGAAERCPECRKAFTIPQDGPHGFPVNFHLLKLMDMKRASETGEGLSTLRQFVLCADCSHKLCERCSLTYSKVEGGPQGTAAVPNADVNKSNFTGKFRFSDVRLIRR